MFEEIQRLFDIPYYQQKHYPQSDALCAKVNGNWVKHSTEEYIKTGNKVSRGLLKMGIKPGDKVALISNNRPEWNMLDMGILQIGAIDVPIYPTISSEDYKFIFNDAGVVLCVVSDHELYDKVQAVRDQIPSLKEVYTIEEYEDTKNWKEILEAGDDSAQSEVEALKSEIKTDDLATLIYTSGTTGTPKGVMLSHRNIVSNSVACVERLPVGKDAIALSFLPVCHIYERMLMYLYQLTGVSIYFAESIETIGDNLREVKPHVFTAVPRLLEKVFDKIMAKGAELTGVKHSLFFWAVGLANEYDTHGKSAWYHFKLSIANKLIFSKWREALGGRAEAVASGSAALQPRLARIFLAAGIPVMEGYGLTETSPVISVNCADNDGLRIGSVGRVIEHVTVKIAEDGEILVKGPNVMLGYYNREDLTKEVIDEDGWFHTGDIGEVSSDGFIRITDRKKEMFKTSGGKYIAPQMMENRFKESLFIEQIMVIGENEKHPAALVVPAFEYLAEWAKRNWHSYDNIEDFASSDVVKAQIWEEVQKTNADFGGWEQIKKIEILAKPWTVDTEELTPTLKLKRKIIKKKYHDQIEHIYRPS